jgi:hypothetical protein
MKKLRCRDCDQEINFIDAIPIWDLLRPGPPKAYSCKECGKNVPEVKSNAELAYLLSLHLLKNEKINIH